MKNVVSTITVMSALVVISCGPSARGKASEPMLPTTATASQPTGAAVTPDMWNAAGIVWNTPPRAAESMPFTPPVAQSFMLANGARVVLVENHRLPLVTVESLHAAAGSREDGAAFGLASMTADLLDEGAGKFTADTLPEELERIGASLDVSTGADYSSIAMSALGFDRAAELLADVVLRPTFTQADFDRVKADRLEELAQRKDNPRAVASVVFEKVVFGEHPYAAPNDGDVATVRAITLPQVKAFWSKAYAPQNAVFIIAGDVTRTQVEKTLNAQFASWKKTSLTIDRKPPVAGPTAPMVAFVHRPDAPQSVVLIGRRSMAAGDPRYFPSEVVNTVLGGSFASRLNHKLREELGYTYGINSSFWRGRWGGTFTVSSSIRTEVTVPGIEEVMRIVNDARSTLIGPEEWKKSQDLLIRGLPQDFETNSGIVSAFHRLVVDGAPLDWYQTWVQKMAATTPAEAQSLADSLWANLSIVIVGDETKVSTKTLGLPVVKFDADGKPLSALPGLQKNN
jgi:zinc protease